MAIQLAFQSVSGACCPAPRVARTPIQPHVDLPVGAGDPAADIAGPRPFASLQRKASRSSCAWVDTLVTAVVIVALTALGGFAMRDAVVALDRQAAIVAVPGDAQPAAPSTAAAASANAPM